MKSVLWPVSALVFVIAASAHASLEGTVNKASKKFGIPITTEIVGNDDCVEGTLKGWTREFDGLPKQQRNAAKEKFRRYSGLAFGRSETTGTLRGRAYVKADEACDTWFAGSCWHYHPTSRRDIFVDGRTIEGHAPSTSVNVSGGGIQVTVSVLMNEADYDVYVIKNEAFPAVIDLNALRGAIEGGSARSLTIEHWKPECSRYSLIELLAQLQ